MNKNWRRIFQAEVDNIIYQFRKYNKWISEDLAHTLETFYRLKTHLKSCKDPDLSVFITPFLDAIKAEMPGPYFSAVLCSIQKFLDNYIISENICNIAYLVQYIVDSITHAKFVGTDQSNDEIILLKIIQIIRTLITSEIGSYMSNQSVCECMQSCFRLCFQTRLSDLLRKVSETVLMEMVKTLFIRINENNVTCSINRMNSLEVGNQISLPDNNKNEQNECIISENCDKVIEETNTLSTDIGSESVTTDVESNDIRKYDSNKVDVYDLSKNNFISTRLAEQLKTTPPVTSGISPDVSLRKYDLSCINELLFFLSNIINPYDRNNTQNMVLVGLNLSTIAMEGGIKTIEKSPDLLKIVGDKLCRNLFSLLKCDIVNLYINANRVLLLIFESLRHKLKFQMEMFIHILIEIISNENVRNGLEKKEMALDDLNSIFSTPDLTLELFSNYDCQLFCSNLVEDSVKCLSKVVYKSGHFNSSQYLAVDSLSSIVSCINDNIYKYDIRKNCSLTKNKENKKVLLTAIEAFNNKPSKGIDLLAESELLSYTMDSNKLVHLFRESPLFDKKVLGDFLGDRKNYDILDAFIRTFDFRNLRIDEALRMFLETFRLPGESPVISNILESFALNFLKQNPDGYYDVDSVFTLAYAVIMLNVDQHNENVKQQRSMTPEDFKRNVRGVNGGKDFPSQYCEEIFNSIKNEEIIMPSERMGSVKENYEWKLLLHRSQNNLDYVNTELNLPLYKFFSTIYPYLLTSFNHMLSNCNEKTSITRVISALKKTATLSSELFIPEALDDIVLIICHLIVTHITYQAQVIVFDENTAILLGSRYKPQIFCKTLFFIIYKLGSGIINSWIYVLIVIRSFLIANLLPSSVTEVEDFSNSTVSILSFQKSSSKSENSSLFSSFYQFITSSAETVNLNQQQEESIKNAQNIIKECKIEEFTSQSKALPDKSLFNLIKAITIMASNIKISNNDFVYSTNDFVFQNDFLIDILSIYNESSSAFFNELLVEIILINCDRMNSFWPITRDHFYRLIVLTKRHSFLVERAIILIIKMTSRLIYRSGVANPNISELFRMLVLCPLRLIKINASNIIDGIIQLVQVNGDYIDDCRLWSIILCLIDISCAGITPLPPSMACSPTIYSDKNGHFEWCDGFEDSVVENINNSILKMWMCHWISILALVETKSTNDTPCSSKLKDTSSTTGSLEFPYSIDFSSKELLRKSINSFSSILTSFFSNENIHPSILAP